jgi:hypothetical protein
MCDITSQNAAEFTIINIYITNISAVDPEDATLITFSITEYALCNACCSVTGIEKWG